jgi:hypothetical protein
MTSYEQKLAAEAELWGAEAEKQAQSIPPDWRYHRRLCHNLVMHAANTDAPLGYIQPGMTALEANRAGGGLGTCSTNRRRLRRKPNEVRFRVTKLYGASHIPSLLGI